MLATFSYLFPSYSINIFISKFKSKYAHTLCNNNKKAWYYLQINTQKPVLQKELLKMHLFFEGSKTVTCCELVRPHLRLDDVGKGVVCGSCWLLNQLSVIQGRQRCNGEGRQRCNGERIQVLQYNVEMRRTYSLPSPSYTDTNLRAKNRSKNGSHIRKTFFFFFAVDGNMELYGMELSDVKGRSNYSTRIRKEMISIWSY